MTAPWIAAFGALWFLVVLLALAVIGMIRRTVAVLERAEQRLGAEYSGVPLLSVIPSFEVLDDNTGEVVSSADLLQGPTILMFMEAGCDPCRQLAAELAEAELLELPLIIVAGEQGLGQRFALPPSALIVRQKGHEVARLFQSAMTPNAFVVDEAGVVLDRVVPGSVTDLQLLARRQRAGLARVPVARN
jgi:hypothetical protein